MGRVEDRENVIKEESMENSMLQQWIIIDQAVYLCSLLIFTN